MGDGGWGDGVKKISMAFVRRVGIFLEGKSGSRSRSRYSARRSSRYKSLLHLPPWRRLLHPTTKFALSTRRLSTALDGSPSMGRRERERE